MNNAAHWEEMSRRLAEQLCRTYLELLDADQLPYRLDMEMQRLDGCVSMIPDAIFPFHLWEKRHDMKPAASMLQTPQSDEQPPANTNPHTEAGNAPQGCQIELPIP